MSKDQILQNYLNIAYFGDGAYGIESAAERLFFGTTAARLTLSRGGDCWPGWCSRRTRTTRSPAARRRR